MDLNSYCLHLLEWCSMNNFTVITSLRRKYLLFGKAPICNEKPERGIKIFQLFFPLCVRCSGLCAGSVFASLLGINHYSSFSSLMLGILLLLPMVIDVAALIFTNWKGQYHIRGLTGLLFGMGLIFFR